MRDEKYFDYFLRITGYDLSQSFSLLSSFLSNELRSFIAFYTGDISILKGEKIKALDELKNSFDKIISLIYKNKESFSNSYWFDFLDNIETIRTQIDSFYELKRFMRSATTNASNSQFFSESILLKDNQTIESFLLEANLDDSENRWKDVAIDNLLAEDSYDSFSNTELKIKFRTLVGTTDITGVVDTIDSKNVYGKDIKNDFEFVENDVLSLNNVETFNQSCEILSGLKKNDNLLYRDLGIDREIVVGANRSAILFLSLFRQMSESFSTDDSIKSFGINSVEVNQDGLFVDYTIESVANDIVNKSVLFT